MPNNADTERHESGISDPEGATTNQGEVSADLPEVTASRTDSTPPPLRGSDQSQSTAEIRRLVQEVVGTDATVALCRDAATDTQLALITSGTAGGDQAGSVRRALLARFAEHGHNLLPFLIPPAAREGAADSPSSADWLTLFGCDDKPQQLFAHLRKAGRYPAAARKLVVKTARDYAAIIDFLHGNVDMPCHAWLHATEAMVRTLFELLFAMYDQRFSTDLSAISLYNAKIMGYGAFNRNDILTYFEIAALARQAKQHYLVTGKELDNGGNFDRAEVLQSAVAICHKLESLCQSTLRTNGERRRQRTFKRVALASSLGLLLILGIWAYVATRPIQPIADTSVIRNPGGIVATYYRGTNFERKVLERWEARPFIWAGGAPAPGVSADNWSVRWAGFLFFPETETTTLCIDNDDGGRVFLGGRKIIDDWRGGAMRRNCKRVRVKKGWYPVRMELFDMTAGAVFRILRGKDKRGAREIPSAHFCCRTGKGVTPTHVRRRPLQVRLVPPTLVRSIGGRGGARRHDYNCQKNSAISELRVGQQSKGNPVNSLRPVCQILSRKGTQPQFLGFPRTGGNWGTPQRNPQKITCPSGKVLVGIYGRHAKFINGIGGLCADPFDKKAAQTKTAVVGSVSGATFELKCPSGSLLHGLFGRSGDLLDSLGIRCVAHRSLTILVRKAAPTSKPLEKGSMAPSKLQPKPLKRRKPLKPRRKKRRAREKVAP